MGAAVRTCGACHRPIEGYACAPCWVAWVFEELAAVALQAARKPVPEPEDDHPLRCRCYQCDAARNEDAAWDRAKEARL